MKRERLDQILLRLGHVTDGQLEQALLRQRAHGGRLGTHLIYFKFISEEQLVEALSEQHEVPSFVADRYEFPRALINKLPVAVAREHQVLPIRLNSETRELEVVAANPGDDEMLSRIAKIFLVPVVKVRVAPESLVDMLVAQCYDGESSAAGAKRIVELPDLFDHGESDDDPEATAPLSATRPPRNVVLITTASSLKSFLVPVFAREGCTLHVVPDCDSAQDILRHGEAQHVLVSPQHFDEFSETMHNSGLRGIEVTPFHSVSGALLDNPAPYRRIIRSLVRSLQTIAELRCKNSTWFPPYPLICSDVRKLSNAFGLGRLASDALQITAYLLVPGGRNEPAQPDDVTLSGPLRFVDFGDSLELARSLHFPWDLEKTLNELQLQLSGNRTANDPPGAEWVHRRGAQILAVVWFYRAALRAIDGWSKDVGARIKSTLRDHAGRLADLELIETYIRLLEQDREVQPAQRFNQVFVVGPTDDISQTFAARLGRSGFKIVAIEDLAEARQMCERHAPAAILIDRDRFPDEIMQAGGLFKLDAALMLYAFTRESEPSLTLDLLDAGFDDVFTPPYDFDIIIARMNKSLRGLAPQPNRPEPAGGFSATFKAFSLIDLLQTLGQSLKTVRIRLKNGAGQQAEICMLQGRIVYASCGQMSGLDAAYEVIRWQDDGGFSVEPTEDVTQQNIAASNEAILMEGCRLLDESHV